MERKELEERILAAIEEYIAAEETYDDTAQLRIDPAAMMVTLTDSEDSDTPDNDDADYYDVMDLVKMSPDDPGIWIPDMKAIASVAAEYA